MADAAESTESTEALLAKVAAKQQELTVKKTFSPACAGLVEVCDAAESLPEPVVQALVEAIKKAFRILQSRFTQPRFWQAGLDLFLAAEFQLPADSLPDLATWRDAALEEVDDDCRERAQQEKQRRKLEEQRRLTSPFGDANVDLSNPQALEELMAAQGLAMDEGRPGMSRDAQHELRVVTILEEGETCSVCQEDFKPGSKAKTMPCGHRFHDDCLMQWVKKNNSCPVCRYDEMPSEKKHFDRDVRRIQENTPVHGIYS